MDRGPKGQRTRRVIRGKAPAKPQSCATFDGPVERSAPAQMCIFLVHRKGYFALCQ